MVIKPGFIYSFACSRSRLSPDIRTHFARLRNSRRPLPAGLPLKQSSTCAINAGNPVSKLAITGWPRSIPP
jgi:hypothetical protein